MTRLADIAPRLARARDQWVAERLRLDVEERLALHQWHSARWRLEHRDLQLLRAFRYGTRRYIAERQRKLDAARRDMERADARLDRVRRERRELVA